MEPEFDIDLPSPVAVANALELNSSLTQEQAVSIAAEVYQPLRNLLKELALRPVR